METPGETDQHGTWYFVLSWLSRPHCLFVVLERYSRHDLVTWYLLLLCQRGWGGGEGLWGYSRANHPRWVLVNDTMPAPCVIVLQQVVLFLKIVRSQNLLERIGFIS